MLKKSQVLKEGRRQGLREAMHIITNMLNEAKDNGGYNYGVNEIWNWLSTYNLAIDGEEQEASGMNSGMDDDEWEEYLDDYNKSSEKDARSSASLMNRN